MFYKYCQINITTIILCILLTGCGFSKGNCGDNKDCFKNAVEKCIPEITANTKYKNEIFKKRNVFQKIIGEENGMCKVYNKIDIEVEVADSEAKSHKETYVYYEMGNFYNIIKTEDINKD